MQNWILFLKMYFLDPHAVHDHGNGAEDNHDDDDNALAMSVILPVFVHKFTKI